MFSTIRLQIQAVGSALLLPVQDTLFRLLEVFVCDLHTAFTKRHQTSFSTDGLDVSAGQVILGHDELRKVDISRKGHLRCVDVEDSAFSFLIRQWELDLAIDSAGADQGRVESLNAIGGHDHLDVATRVKTVELVQQLQHGSLDLAFAAGVGVVSLCAHSVDFVDENDGRCVFFCNTEQLADEFRSITLKGIEVNEIQRCSYRVLPNISE